jgi:hypothetical protein
MNNNNYWTDEEEQLLKSWAEKASCYRWMHDKSSKFYLNKNNKLGIPSMILSLVAGASIFSTINIQNEEFEIGFKTVIGLLNLSAAILSGLQNFLNLPSLIEKHHASSINFSNYYRNIVAEISMPESKRTNALNFVKTCKTEFNKLIHNAPDIPNHIIDSFILEFKDYNLSKPDVANGLVKIQTEYDIDPENKIIIKKYNDVLNLIQKYDNSMFNLINNKINNISTNNTSSIELKEKLNKNIFDNLELNDIFDKKIILNNKDTFEFTENIV